MKKIAVVLCGCGQRDGSEIHEAVTTLLAIARAGYEYICYAPSGPQARVVNHLNNHVAEGEKRDMLVEAGRIARGKIHDIRELQAQSADALVFPGGNGSAHNIFTFAEEGVKCTVIPEVERVVNAFFEAKKPIGFICIASVLGAKVLGKHAIELTVGNDAATIHAITVFGAKHIEKTVTEAHIDTKHKIVSTPAYMLAKSIAEVDVGVTALVKGIVGMMD